MKLRLEHYGAVTSTMDVAMQAALAGAAEGLVVVAETQTAGRGRRGRVWSSPDGAGLYFSFLLRPATDEASRASLSLITLAAGVAVRDAILRRTGVCAELKWPNDVMVGSRKLAGILAEGMDLGSRRQAVVLGVGVNVARAVHDDDVARRATSLEVECGHPVDRAPLLETLIQSIAGAYASLRGGEPSSILDAWRAAAPSAHGAAVEWDTDAGRCRGTTAGIDDSGALLVDTGSSTERVVGGELCWLS